jgi:hypothetical protein
MKGRCTARAIGRPDTCKIKLHLQEGFTGETVVTRLDGAVVGERTARMRMQLGLAHVERLRVRAGLTLPPWLPPR